MLFDGLDRLCHRAVAALLLQALQAGQHPVGQYRLLRLDGFDILVLGLLLLLPALRLVVIAQKRQRRGKHRRPCHKPLWRNVHFLTSSSEETRSIPSPAVRGRLHIRSFPLPLNFKGQAFEVVLRPSAASLVALSAARPLNCKDLALQLLAASGRLSGNPSVSACRRATSPFVRGNSLHSVSRFVLTSSISSRLLAGSKARSFRCSSSPNWARFAGPRFGF